MLIRGQHHDHGSQQPELGTFGTLVMVGGAIAGLVFGLASGAAGFELIVLVLAGPIVAMAGIVALYVVVGLAGLAVFVPMKILQGVYRVAVDCRLIYGLAGLALLLVVLQFPPLLTAAGTLLTTAKLLAPTKALLWGALQGGVLGVVVAYMALAFGSAADREAANPLAGYVPRLLTAAAVGACVGLLTVACGLALWPVSKGETLPAVALFAALAQGGAGAGGADPPASWTAALGAILAIVLLWGIGGLLVGGLLAGGLSTLMLGVLGGAAQGAARAASGDYLTVAETTPTRGESILAAARIGARDGAITGAVAAAIAIHLTAGLVEASPQVLRGVNLSSAAAALVLVALLKWAMRD